MCFRCESRSKTFQVSNWNMSQMKDAVSPELLDRSSVTSLLFLTRDIAQAGILFYGVQNLDLWISSSTGDYSSMLRALLWISYWWFQSLSFMGLWILGHECGHGAFSPSTTICDTVGFIVHSALGTPYFSWKYSHAIHHRYHAHMDKDEHWIPHVKSDAKSHHEAQEDQTSALWEAIEDTPIFLILSLVIQQLVGFNAYLAFNASGQPSYPPWTNHFNPRSVLFQGRHYFAVVASDAGLLGIVYMLVQAGSRVGFLSILRLYIVPWLLMCHWISMIVFLQHTDPRLPHYRSGEWTYARGALATMDRPFLGWQGEFFLHNIAHSHVIHHFFPKMPFYHAAEATEQIKKVLGSDYNYCDSPVFVALWQNFRRCQYVDETGDVLFYKDTHGASALQYDGGKPVIAAT